MLNGLEKCDVFRGHARFRSAREVAVGETLLRADRIFINVGGRAAVPNCPASIARPFLTNSSMMDLSVLPEHLVIVGGSYVGLEFGQMFRRFGSRGHDRRDGIGAHRTGGCGRFRGHPGLLEEEGIGVRLNARCITVSGGGSKVTAHVECTEGAPAVTGSHLLLATGRRPNTDDLGLDAAGIKQDERGYVVVDDQLRTSVEGVWALGDCNGKGAFTHTSYNDYEIVAANLLESGQRRVSRSHPGVRALHRSAAWTGRLDRSTRFAIADDRRSSVRAR